MSDKLKITGHNCIPKTYDGSPCVLSVNIIDKDGGVYESDIHFDEGMTADKLKEAMMNVFRMTDAIATELHIKSFKIKK